MSGEATVGGGVEEVAVEGGWSTSAATRGDESTAVVSVEIELSAVLLASKAPPAAAAMQIASIGKRMIIRKPFLSIFAFLASVSAIGKNPLKSLPLIGVCQEKARQLHYLIGRRDAVGFNCQSGNISGLRQPRDKKVVIDAEGPCHYVDRGPTFFFELGL